MHRLNGYNIVSECILYNDEFKNFLLEARLRYTQIEKQQLNRLNRMLTSVIQKARVYTHALKQKGSIRRGLSSDSTFGKDSYTFETAQLRKYAQQATEIKDAIKRIEDLARRRIRK